MKPHKSAPSSHYNKEADSYDAFNEKNSTGINNLIEKNLNAHAVKTVLDLSCGTGSQVLWLAKRGYDVIGVDINTKMLKIAKDKAEQANLPLRFIKGDMRTSQMGCFDAVLTIFNAIGHLTKKDFEKTLCNVNTNLRKGGLYLFDIFNLNYLLHGNNITKLTIDWQESRGGVKVREVQHSTIDQNGILASYDIYYRQEGSDAAKITKASQTLQVYTAKQLEEMLHHAGFRLLNLCDTQGNKFDEYESERIFIVAQKI